ncbi:MAG: bifunctional UDP-N-acetylglucosamine diphosphorylase/glucosamine-1-phosphate N-acetyltransferase GlmU [Firmicutes bacterium]|nr:bifunctional UDP-N-acetylglucosamine diphosphorylase/glucosamine-1-phosphate N-acetyltransferase GlmU [Dethiobacter sp.]MBS3889193.1 bifunctional UDP-N-acetylglucosamine diphosphorylase/glucosamine-1-phosphate N-acetyltransferase GlmU [Bacillota bacterium]
MGQEIAAVVLAAGEGKRMKSRLVKTAHKVAGLPIVTHVLRAALAVGASKVITVVGKDAAEVEAAAQGLTQFVTQHERLGTGHACQQAEGALEDFAGVVLVLCGDAPLITPHTLARMLAAHESAGALATVLTARPLDVRGLGRIKRAAGGEFVAIVEEKDASPTEREIKEINAGFYCFSAPHLFAALRQINSDNAQGEYMLTDVLALLRQQGVITTVLTDDFAETIGINDRIWLCRAEEALQKRIQEKLMLGGVTIVSPSTTYIEVDVQIGSDTVVWPGSVLKGSTVVGEGCQIGPSTVLENAVVLDEATVVCSVVREARIGAHAEVGPFAHLRPGCELGSAVRIGNFVEVKKSSVGDETKISHLSYVGDAVIGAGVNLGAGTIIVNYDGCTKHQTVIGEGAFVGCNSNLIAPLVLGENSFVAAGSTVTRDVPANALAVGRARQENKADWVLSRRRRSLDCETKL